MQEIVKISTSYIDPSLIRLFVVMSNYDYIIYSKRTKIACLYRSQVQKDESVKIYNYYEFFSPINTGDLPEESYTDIYRFLNHIVDTITFSSPENPISTYINRTNNELNKTCYLINSRFSSKKDSFYPDLYYKPDTVYISIGKHRSDIHKFMAKNNNLDLDREIRKSLMIKTLFDTHNIESYGLRKVNPHSNIIFYAIPQNKCAICGKKLIEFTSNKAGDIMTNGNVKYNGVYLDESNIVDLVHNNVLAHKFCFNSLTSNLDVHKRQNTVERCHPNIPQSVVDYLKATQKI